MVFNRNKRVAKQGKVEHFLQSCSLWELNKLIISAKSSLDFILQRPYFRFTFLACEEVHIHIRLCVSLVTCYEFFADMR